MKLSSEEILKRYFGIFEGRECMVSSEDYERFENNRRLLMRIAEVENSSLVVIDLAKRNYLLVCSKFNFWEDFGINADTPVLPEKLFQYMHPEDLPFVVDTAVKSFDFIDSLPAGEKTDYKLISDFRLITKSGTFVRFVQQTVVLELDKAGEIWLALKLVDLLPDKEPQEPPQRKMLNMKSGKLCLFNDQFDNQSKNILTKRETEILGLIYKGMDSNEISQRLIISLNTVNNHRQNILSKTKNTAQALLYARKLGLI